MRLIDNGPLRTAILDCFNPYLLPNKALEWSLKGAPGDASYLLDGSNLLSLMADRSGNSAENCLVLNGVTGNNASVPNAAYWPRGDMEIIVRLRMDAVGSNAIGGRLETATTRSFGLQLATAGANVCFTYSVDGSAVVQLQVPHNVAAMTDIWLRAQFDVDNGAGGKTCAFAKSTDGTQWTDLGSASSGTGGTALLFASSDIFTIGKATLAIAGNFAGQIFYFEVRDGIGGPAVFREDFTTAPKLAATVTEQSVNAATVTIITSGDLGAHLSGARDYFQNTGGKRFTTAIVNGFLRALADGSNDYGASPSFSLPQPFTLYLVFEQTTFTNGDVLIDGRANDSAQLWQDTTTPNLSLYAGANGPTTTQVPLATKHVLGMILNGANSYIGVDELEPILGNAGTATPNGITLAARAAGTLNGHLGFYELLAFNGAHSLPMFRRVRKALKRVNGIS